MGDRGQDAESTTTGGRPASAASRRTPSRRGLGGTFTAFAERDYAWFFVGNIAFFMGMQMQNLLRGFLAFELTDTAAALGYISASMAVPMLVVSPIGGVIADRVNKRTLLVVTQLVAAATTLTVGILILADLIRFWHLLVVSGVMGSVFAANMPARQALVPQLVPQHKMMNAISLQMGGMNLTRIMAPATAGLLIAPLGVGWVYIVTFALFLVAVASEFQLPTHGMVVKKRPAGMREDLVGGFRYIRTHRTIMMLLGLGLVFPLFAFPLQQMLPVFADDVFGKGSAGLGVLAASTGVGGVVGALIAANLDHFRHKGRIMLIGGLWMGGLFIAFTQVPGFWLALIFLALGNVGGMVFQTTNNTVVQSQLPAEVRGRVMSVMLMSFGLMPLGVLPVGVAADAVGARTAVAGSSTLLIVAVLAFFLLSRRLRHLTIDPLARADLSPVQAAQMVAEGKLTEEEAERRTRESDDPDWGGPLREGPIETPLETPTSERAPEAALEPAPALATEQTAVRAVTTARSLSLLRPFAVSGVLVTGLLLGFVASGSSDVWRGLRRRLGRWISPDR